MPTILRAVACNVALLSVGVAPAVAQPTGAGSPSLDPAKTFSGFTVVTEQDFLLPLANEDRNYTMGVGFGFAGELGYDPDPVFSPWRLTAGVPWIREGLDRAILGLLWTSDDWLNKDGRAIGLSEYSWTVGTTAFTPDDLANPEPIFDDRPYASLIFLSSRRTRVHRNERWAVTSDLTLGALGLDVAEEVQTWIHERIDADIPQGWGHQISEGGELTGLYTLRFQHLPGVLNERFDDEGYRLQWTWHALGQLGYYVAGEAGLAFRTGWFNSRFWQWASNPLNSQNEALRAPGEERELFAFGALRGRRVHHNSLLEGQFNRSVVTVEAEPWLLEGEAGLSGSMVVQGRRIGLTWVAVAGRSPEIQDAAERRSHLWSALFATVRFGN